MTPVPTPPTKRQQDPLWKTFADYYGVHATLELSTNVFKFPVEVQVQVKKMKKTEVNSLRPLLSSMGSLEEELAYSRGEATRREGSALEGHLYHAKAYPLTAKQVQDGTENQIPVSSTSPVISAKTVLLTGRIGPLIETDAVESNKNMGSLTQPDTGSNKKTGSLSQPAYLGKPMPPWKLPHSATQPLSQPQPSQGTAATQSTSVVEFIGKHSAQLGSVVEFLGKHSVFSAYTSIVTLISDLLPPFAKSKDNSNFWKISNPKGLGLLFPHPQSSARSYAEGSVLEFHRRALRLERTAADLTTIISRIYSNKLFMAALADTSMSQQMEFIVHHGGAVHGSGVDFWSTPNAPDRESELDPKQHEVDPGVSDLSDMVSWMRANRDSAFSRQYVVVDEMTWGIPLLVTIIVTMGRFGSKVDQSVLSQAVCDVFRMRSGIITEVGLCFMCC